MRSIALKRETQDARCTHECPVTSPNSSHWIQRRGLRLDEDPCTHRTHKIFQNDYRTAGMRSRTSDKPFSLIINDAVPVIFIHLWRCPSVNLNPREIDNTTSRHRDKGKTDRVYVI